MPEIAASEVPVRYAQDQMAKEAGVKVKYFEPIDNNRRDRFGNRIFTSSDLSYRDKSDALVKAGLLVSTEGEKLIRSCRGVLRDIEKGLIELEYVLEEETGARKKQVDLSNGRSMEYLTSHGQSNIYLLIIGKEKFIVKTKNRAALEATASASQPYINEMLQTQAMAADLNRVFSKLHIAMSSFLFASGDVSCVRYEEGSTPTMNDFANGKADELRSAALSYIASQREKGQDLWSNITVDLTHDSADAPVIRNLWAFAFGNFKKREDGTLVWIDPFLYKTE